MLDGDYSFQGEIADNIGAVKERSCLPMLFLHYTVLLNHAHRFRSSSSQQAARA